MTMATPLLQLLLPLVPPQNAELAVAIARTTAGALGVLLLYVLWSVVGTLTTWPSFAVLYYGATDKCTSARTSTA